MAFSLKNKIMGFFPRSMKVRDGLKDGDGKGTFERYQELVAEEWDENSESLISDISAKTVNPETALLSLLPYLEQVPGTPYPSSVEAQRRRGIKAQIRFNRIKGTPKAIKALFKLFLGFDVTITEFFNFYGFDSSETLDSPVRTFDGGICKQYCTSYSVTLTGGGTLTTEQYIAIFQILEYNNPINAKIKEVTYNGDVILPFVVLVTIDANGHLTYDNYFDPDLTLSLDASGNLIISGPRADNYSIDSDGHLIFTI